MKKTLVLVAAGALALPAILLANSDRIEIKLGRMINKIWIDDVDNLSVLKDNDSDQTFSTLQVVYKSGETDEWKIDKIKGMNWVNGNLQPSSLDMDVWPHQHSITLYGDCEDPDVRYSFGVLPIEYFGNKSECEWHDMILEYESELIQSYVDSYGFAVTDKPASFYFPYSGNSKITWYPASMEDHIAMPGKEFVAYLYEGDIDANGLVLTHDVSYRKVTAKTLETRDVDYQINVDVDPSFINATVTSPDNEPFCIFLIKASELDLNNLDAAAINQITALEYNLFNYGSGDWDTVSYIGTGEYTSGHLLSGDSYYVLAVGCEYGTMTSHAVISDLITVPYPSVTDDCTFSVASENVTVSEINLDITPSNAQTAYVTYLTEAGKVDNPLEFMTHAIYGYMQRGQLRPEPSEDNKYVFTGAHKINSLANCLEGKPMIVGNEYVFYTVGIDSKGTPTTAVNEFHYTPSAPEQSMTFNISFDTENFDMSDSYSRNLHYRIEPSDNEMKYVFDKQKMSQAKLNMSDDEFISDWVNSYGKWLTTYTGVRDTYTTFSSSWNNEIGGYAFEPYIIFVFGFDGTATSALYMYKFDPANGELTQLRGPGAE